jgi:5'-phosphate synthase pdxT subunit
VVAQTTGTGQISIRVGILALQGDVAEHEALLTRVGAESTKVRHPEQLERIDGLVLPGGESTTIAMLASDYDLTLPIRKFIASGRAVWGTCGGLILLAREVAGGQSSIGGLDIVVERNAFGRQVHSFEASLAIAGLDDGPFDAVFIRAPAVRSVGPAVDVLSRLTDGTIVAVREGNVVGTSFHPELGDDERFHRMFVRMCRTRDVNRPPLATTGA